MGVFLGTPCTSWSRALRRALRSRACPMGIASSELSAVEQSRLANGNASFLFSCRIIDLCIRCGVPVMLENPASSLMWSAPRMIQLCKKSEHQQAHFHMCQFGTRWQKATRISSWLAPSLLPLCRKCNGSGGFCSRTSKPHVVLSGRAPGGAHWTAIAAAYPPLLAKAIARLMVDGSQRRSLSRLWNLASGLDPV